MYQSASHCHVSLTSRVLSLITCCFMMAATNSFGQYSSLVTYNTDGTLAYTTDADGNRIPDFAYAGYKLGKEPIPKDIAVAVTVSPIPGDNTANIQAAIDQVQTLSVDADGFRGMVLLKAGIYEVSTTLRITKGGVVLRGEGPGKEGTVIFHSGSDSESTLFIAPTAGGIGLAEVTSVTDSYVSVGQNTLQVADTSGLTVGQTVFIKCQHNQQWINDLGLASYWTNPADLDIKWERIIAAINSSANEITLDAPLTSIVDQQGGYAQARIYRLTSDARLTNVGVENIMFVSDYNRAETDAGGYYNDEDHASSAIHFGQAKDCWVQRCIGFFYWKSFVYSWTNCNRITVQDCAMFDGVSFDTPTTHSGSREYYFCMDGSNMLVQRCFARGARHAFITNGPKSNITFLDCYSLDGHLSQEPHQRWTTAVLFDNVYSDSQFKLEGNLGSHGQKAANSVLWNCYSNNRRYWEPEIYLNHAPGLLAKNWVVGCIIDGLHTDPAIENVANFGSDGHVESTDIHVKPRSLYMAQARDMNGEAAVYGTVANHQFISGQAAYDNLLAKYSAFPSFSDPDNLAAWLPDTPSYEPVITDQGNISLLDESASIDSWSNCLEVTSPVYSGSVSAKWDGINQDAWKFMRPANLPSDWSGYDSITFSMYSAVNNGASFVIIATSANINGNSDYYMYTVNVDWTGWQTFHLPFASFNKVRSPAGWQKIDQLTFANKGWGAILKPDTELYIDALSLENSAEEIQLNEAESISEWSNSSVAYAHYISGTVSAKWEGVNLDAYKHFSHAYTPAADWSAHDSLNFWMYSAVANDANFAIVATSENTNGASDYYLYNIDVDWTGWKEFTIPFSSFKGVRNPAGWHQINKLTFANKGWAAIIKPDTELYIDHISVKSN